MIQTNTSHSNQAPIDELMNIDDVIGPRYAKIIDKSYNIQIKHLRNTVEK